MEEKNVMQEIHHDEKDRLFEELEELEHNDLDDIVLENMDRKERIKRYIIIFLAVIILAITIISIIKLVTSSSSTPQELLSEEVPIEQQQEDIELKETLPVEESIDIEQGEEKSDVDKLINEIITKNSSPATTNALSKPAPKKEKQHSTSNVQKTKVQTKTSPSHPPKKKKVVQKPTHQQATKKSSSANTITKKYFIQAGAFFKYPPNKAFLKKIKDANYNFTIIKTQKNGVRVQKVLIGPFATRKEAEQALVKIRTQIAKGAFITKVR